ncbi:MAG TPA: S-layer homology domain-containing protein [Thermoanaerobaculia bacterium]|nr:S-layer homology domain-containing protein [Thermoanaerobaculia bacterium]
MRLRRFAAVLTAVLALFAGGAAGLLGTCGPFTDMANDLFCPFVLEIFYLGITTGTTATTYSPGDSVSRLQMAAFLSRTVDSVLLRGSRRARLNQFWTTQAATALGVTEVGLTPQFVKSDCTDLWVSDPGLQIVARVRGSDGAVLESWTSGINPRGVLVASGRVFIAANTNPGRMYMIDPSEPVGSVTTVSTALGVFPQTLTYDGSNIWSANSGGSVSIITPGGPPPWTVTTVTAGFSQPNGTLFDGANVWVTDFGAQRLFKLDGNGAILQTVTLGSGLAWPAFDGTNIWAPGGGSVWVVRASTGAVLATLTDNGLTNVQQAAFDGRRVLVTSGSDHRLALWKAADLTAIGSLDTGAGTSPLGACSDGKDFWVALSGAGGLARF